MSADRGGDLAPSYLAVGMAELPGHDRWLSQPEAERLQGMAFTKRRDESRLGRWTAKRALAQALGLDENEPAVLRQLMIRNAPDGAPEAFLAERQAPVSISMTDRADWAVCTVVGGAGPIGCDLELIEPRSLVFVADYFTPAEQECVARTPGDHDLLANLIWSAKESTLKVLRTGLRRDTRSVEVRVDRRPLDDGWCALAATTAEQLTFTGWWRRFGPFVLTYMSAEDTAPPASFIDPSPLHGAVPNHSWIADPRRPSAG